MSNQNNGVQPAQGNPTKVLVFGIIGLALCETGLLGLIFSIVGLVQAKNYVKTYGDISNKVRIGKRLSIAGLIISICMIVMWIAIIALIVFAAASDPKGFESALSKAVSDAVKLS